jgi:hypothetical protein
LRFKIKKRCSFVKSADFDRLNGLGEFLLWTCFKNTDADLGQLFSQKKVISFDKKRIGPNFGDIFTQFGHPDFG